MIIFYSFFESLEYSLFLLKYIASRSEGDIASRSEGDIASRSEGDIASRSEGDIASRSFI